MEATASSAKNIPDRDDLDFLRISRTTIDDSMCVTSYAII